MTESFINVVKNAYDTWYETYKNIAIYNNETDYEEKAMYEFLSSYMCCVGWQKNELRKDKYPIYCYIESEKPAFGGVNGKKLWGYHDHFYNLQKRIHFDGPKDDFENGTNREKFLQSHDIIYAPDGETFKDRVFFYKVQAEFVKEALNTNQDNAKKLLLNKYGRR